AQTRSDVTGMSMFVTPWGASASMTALTYAAGEPTVADSPTPLAPSGWCGDGVIVAWHSNRGVSQAVGSRYSMRLEPMQLPSSSNVISSVNAMPQPSVRPPWIWPSTIIGLIRTPQSWTETTRGTCTTPVPRSTSSTTTYVP